jgi:N-acetylglucosaminyldiphosphoundecaprenol N-acetyl-beta-D-mannosaminyltransferase
LHQAQPITQNTNAAAEAETLAQPLSQHDAGADRSPPGFPRVEILRVGISAVSLEDTVSEVTRWIARGERRYICVTGVHGVMESQRDPELMWIHNESGLTIPDGMPMVWCGRYARAPRIDRIYGPDLMLALCQKAAERGWRSFFYGGAPEVPELLASRLQARFPGLQIAGTISPPFRVTTPAEDEAYVAQINASGAELVWVGLSTPKQERWMARHLPQLSAPKVIIGVGAAFEVHAGQKRDIPGWLGPLGLGWAYRLLQEPRRLWKRYLLNNPKFVWALLRRPPKLTSST